MPINITPQSGFGGRLAEAMANSVGGYGQGYAKQAPQLLDARRSGATTAAITLAPLQNAMDQFGASFRQSYQLAGQMAMQREAINAQKASQSAAHQNAMDMLDRRTQAAANEQFLKMTNGTVALTDIKGSDGTVLIPGISTLWQQQYDADPVRTPPLEKFKIDYMQKIAMAREDDEMAKRGLVRGPDPDEQKELQDRIDALDPNMFPKGSKDWELAAEILYKTFPQKAWHKEKPNFQQMAQSGVAVVGKGPDGTPIYAHNPQLKMFQPRTTQPAGGGRGGSSGQTPIGPDGKPIASADAALDTFAKAAGVTTVTYDGKGGTKFSSEIAEVQIKAFDVVASAMANREDFSEDAIFKMKDRLLADIAKANKLAIDGPVKMAPHVASMYNELEAFRAKWQGKESTMPAEEKKRFQQMYDLYKQAAKTQPSD